MTMGDISPAQLAWDTMLETERQFNEARARAVTALNQTPLASVAILRSALLSASVIERNAALRTLLSVDESVRQDLFPNLVDLASFDTHYLFGARRALESLDRAWREEHLPSEIRRVLDKYPDEEHFRRLAELLKMLGSSYLTSLLELARTSENAAIQEIAGDFDS